MKENSFDCVLVTDGNNIRYFSGFTGEGYLLITDSGLVIVTDFRYTEQAKLQSPHFVVADRADFEFEDFVHSFDKVGFEGKTISYNDYMAFSRYVKNLCSVGDAFTDFRAVKDDEEIECIRIAESIGDLAFEHILDYIRPGVSEREIALEIEFFMRRNGAEALSFDTIAACGAHGAMPHAEPDERLVSKGDLVVLDFGCKYKGYCSDMTRTVCVGKVSDEQKKVYETVLRAQLASVEMLKAGAIPCEVHNTAQKIIDELYPKSFGHSLGHGVGLEIHENPTLSPKNNKPLLKGNVVTVEPGIYLSDFCGVRIEDLVLINDNGIQNLTKSDKKLIEI